MTPRLHELKVLGPHGFTQVAYAEWGPTDAARTAICVHGLTRNGRDFDRLAAILAAQGFRVLCPDMPGRGRSAWLADPSDYGYPLYMAAGAALIARSGAADVAWIGTSMGGLIGMMLAAQPGTPVARLVVNDVGPFIPKAALERIGAYIGHDLRFDDMAEVEAYLRRVHAPFGRLTDAHWRHLAAHSAVPAEQGKLKLHYDPAIAMPFTKGEPRDVNLWPVWENIGCPVLVIRGGASDLLLPETAAEMTMRGRAASEGRIEFAEFDDCGHAPALMDEAQIGRIAAFLEPRQ